MNQLPATGIDNHYSVFHFADKILVDKANAAHVIVKDANFHARLGALRQNLLDAVPCFRVLNRMILHKDEAFCLPQRLLLCFQTFFGTKIPQLCVLIHRIFAVAQQILGYICQLRIAFFQRLHGGLCVLSRLARCQQRIQLGINVLIPLAHRPCAAVETDQKIQKHAQNRKNQN